MSKLAQLRERRTAKAQEANALNARFPADQRMPAAEASALDALLAEIEAIDNDIAREARMAKLAAEQTDNLLDRVREGATRDPAKHSEHAHALKAYFRGGLQGLSPEQLAEHNARVTPDIRAAMSTTTTTEGGFTVATEYNRALEQAMKAYGGMLQAADIINTASGATMNFPTSDATSEVGAIVGQNTTVSRVDTVFGNVAVDAYKYTSNDIAIPWELIQDSFLDIEAFIQELLATRLGRILNTHATVGTGTGQPRGVIPAAALGKTGTTGQTLTVTYDDLIDLEHSVDPAYRALPGVGFMMNDSSLKVVRKIKDSNGRPIFVPGYEQGNPGGAPDRLLNRAIFINQDMASMAANAKSIAFGAFKKYKIRRVMDLTIFRMTDSAFTRAGQVGFVAFQRMGGNLVDVSGATVKYYANSAT
ncbi:phage major capsid protein [Pseudaquabacterium pictum]|uniref:Phage capsid protein n=1 Tax=Pseudaquabacterium pictum TaxID=2315236 RepID=A0A480AIR2_9BURK|nr:phage major capsid protein [Rubrivivax pictus]GCL61501.1 phage capsid protein [Rubrivivax pictus]